ncbi:serine protease [Flavobacterium branchiophilum]|uniref:Protease DegP/Q n=2 Tax=Flavobacterium branchiophilum TaxID=55197 RepID=G2Z4P5_FLABF|nr:trypsin-like peptidase domain-containing protein [Flavobacterium branchiophilum]OXA74610.1 serine protease [Flavobacterium branchiophilum] [Flavobacterium branchiophilum NBRC 15030 = ATCC 35035]TQM40885.1 Do/DeqQ family serine protease [Flavobacterium branchiophilum]GEM54824.1 serine protease [Flavobacterium branchiophilum NBRC 15030 = ATCC 35035]CCB68530.1 Protease DegP/Q precursor [Flavobacterium branchiophilum FL-15]
MRKFSSLFLVSLLSGATTLGAYQLIFETKAPSNSIVTSSSNGMQHQVGFGAEGIDFTTAADKAVHSVVHVKNVSRVTLSNPIMEFFYGSRGGTLPQQEQVGTGSGVIISEDGYIVTNNHVIKDADEIEITLNNKKNYKAKLIGTDSKMDIALLKINADEKLPYSTFSDSDQVKVGEWVLAVGNPYNLTSTVTAGIISAKARNLDTNGIQSFLQTDAAVNPGNSGGALVNTRGELIGINTMISSQTGSYIGYSFAVPSNIARKIIEDIMEFGNVQRGILGVEGNELSGNASKELGIKASQGFYIKKVTQNSGAEKAGLTKGDVIIKLDSQNINSFAELSGYISTKRPNDTVQVTVIRNEKTITLPVVLTKNDALITEFKGIELENIDSIDKKKFRINYGVKIKNINNDRLNDYTNDLKGGIILSIDNVKATDIETVSRIISNKNDNQSAQIELLTNTGQVVRVII